MNPEDGIRRVDASLRNDILKILGLPVSHQWADLCRIVLGKATRHLADIALTFDRMITDQGFNRAAEWSLTNWCKDIRVDGQEKIPTDGPLLVMSNHPGAYDALVIASILPRPDLQIIASDLPFFHALENLKKRIFFIPMNKDNSTGRMAGMLSAVRYLRQGGAVLLMGSGTIDPDPAVYPGALANLNRWTDAVSLFLRFAPDTSVLLSAISHIVHPKWARHPFTWLQKGAMEKRRIAEFGQVIQQLFFPGSLFVSPRLSFSSIIPPERLGRKAREILIEQETQLLKEHCQAFGGIPT